MEIPREDIPTITAFDKAYTLLYHPSDTVWPGYDWQNLSMLLISPSTRHAYLLNSSEHIPGFIPPCNYDLASIIIHVSTSLFGNLPWDGEGYITSYPTPASGSIYIQYLPSATTHPDPNSIQYQTFHPLGQAIHENFHIYQHNYFAQPSSPSHTPEPTRSFTSWSVDSETVPYMFAQMKTAWPFPSSSPDQRNAIAAQLRAIRQIFRDTNPEKARDYEILEIDESTATYVEYLWLEELGIIPFGTNTSRSDAFPKLPWSDISQLYQIFPYHFPQTFYNWLDVELPEWKILVENGATFTDLLTEASGRYSNREPASVTDLLFGITSDPAFAELYVQALAVTRLENETATFLNSPSANFVRISIDLSSGNSGPGYTSFDKLFFRDKNGTTDYLSADTFADYGNITLRTSHTFMRDAITPDHSEQFIIPLVTLDDISTDPPELLPQLLTGIDTTTTATITFTQRTTTFEALDHNGNPTARIEIPGAPPDSDPTLILTFTGRIHSLRTPSGTLEITLSQ